jgi:hypothetical protein
MEVRGFEIQGSSELALSFEVIMDGYLVRRDLLVRTEVTYT